MDMWGASREGIARIHGGKVIGERNKEREKITDHAMVFDHATVNTFFEKN